MTITCTRADELGIDKILVDVLIDDAIAVKGLEITVRSQHDFEFAQPPAGISFPDYRDWIIFRMLVLKAIDKFADQVRVSVELAKLGGKLDQIVEAAAKQQAENVTLFERFSQGPVN